MIRQPRSQRKLAVKLWKNLISTLSSRCLRVLSGWSITLLLLQAAKLKSIGQIKCNFCPSRCYVYLTQTVRRPLSKVSHFILSGIREERLRWSLENYPVWCCFSLEASPPIWFYLFGNLWWTVPVHIQIKRTFGDHNSVRNPLKLSFLSRQKITFFLVLVLYFLSCLQLLIFQLLVFLK